MISLKKLRKDELIRGSFVLFIMMNIFNFFNYLFHFFMARFLGPVDYGVLAVLMSIVYILAIPSEAIQTIISGYTSRFNVKKEYGKMKDLLYRSLKKGFVAALILFILYIPVAFLLAGFLNIQVYLLILTGLLIFYVFLFPILRGILQGRKKFKQLGFNMDIESFLKLILSIVFVFIGWRVYGAMTAVIMAGVIAFFLIFIYIKEIIKSEKKKADFKGIYSYSYPIFITMIAIVLIYSLDIILAKRFFSAELAGQYAVISMLGKMIFFGTAAIGKAMFPFTSENYESGKETESLFKKSMKITLILIGLTLIVFLLLPKLIISVLFGSAYVSASGILYIIGLAFSFISIANIILLYKLSTKRIRKASIFLLFFVVLQIILLGLFHSSLVQFSLALLAVNFLMFLYTLFLIRK